MFIFQDHGKTILEGPGSKQQDIKQVHLVLSGNLDQLRQVYVIFLSFHSCEKKEEKEARSKGLMEGLKGQMEGFKYQEFRATHLQPTQSAMLKHLNSICSHTYHMLLLNVHYLKDGSSRYYREF